MSNQSLNAGGLQEAKEYMMDKEIPQLFESMMTALMYKKPEDHLEFLETCLNKAKEDPKIRWHSFIEPLPPIPKATEKIRSEAESPSPSESPPSQTEVSVDNAPSEPIQKKTEASTLAEQVFKKHMDEINALDNDGDERPWYADYTEKYVDTSAIQGKPIVFVLGGPGSGKGTQCAKIVEKYGFIHLSAGDLLRAEVKKGSEIGAKIDQAIKEGQLVPQDVTICLLKEAMVAKAESKGFLVDGFPREIKQGKQFEKQVASAKLMLNYECPDEVLTTRLIERGKHSGRVDDNMESIKKRLTLFHEKTAPVVEHYSEIVATIQANRSIDNVFEDTCKALEGIVTPERPWYADYTEKYIDTSVIQGKPIVFVLGGPGSGKGTQCAKIVEKYGFIHLSAGDLLRAEVKNGSEIGAKIDQAIKEGQLVPQDVTICLLKEAMVAKADSKGFLIDGFPREIKQGKQFERQVAFAKLMLNYECPDEVLTRRLIERGKHSGRVDDNMESIKKRLILFHEKTAPVVEHYSEIVASIQANRCIDDVFEDTCRALEPLVNVQSSSTSDSHELSKPIVFVLGAQNSGREKQCELLSHRYSLHHVSLDTIMKEDSQKYQELMIESANKIPMDLALEAINKRIHSNEDNNGFIIDGFPRTLEEAVCFEMEICPASFVVYFECPDDVLLRRQLGENAEDDKEEAAKKQLETFHSKMTHIFLKYPDRLKIVNSARSEDIVFQETCDFVDFLITGQKGQAANEEQISPEQQKEIESAVQDIVDEIAPQTSSPDEPQAKSESKPQVEGEEDHVEAQEDLIGESGNKKHVYQEMLKNKKVIFVAGSPGTGKSTQCRKIAETFGYAHISKDLVLREIEAGTERGLKIVEILKNKDSVPDKLAFDILGDAMLELNDCKGYLMEGYPASLQQVAVFEDEFTSADLVLHFTCPEIVSSQRFLSRGQPGDTHENYQERMEVYNEQTLPMLDLKNDIVKEIVVTGEVEEIFEQISKHFNEQKTESKAEETTQQQTMGGDLSDKNIVFVLGGPGSGKGTQCAKIVEKYGFCHLSTGDLLRAEVSSGSARAEEMKEIMAKGELIPLDTILALLKEAMLKNADCKGFILDGYPRDVPQGEKFEESVGKCKFILYFHCTNECMTERLLGRAKTSGRVDDNIDTIKLRLKTFENQTLPILDKYADRIKKIDAMRGVDDIFADVSKELDTL